MPARQGTVYVYRAYNDQGRLLYVGMTGNPRLRMQSHAWKSWCDDVRDISLVAYSSRAEAAEAERQAIMTEWPLWNHDGSPYQFLLLDAFHRYYYQNMRPPWELNDAERRAWKRQVERDDERDAERRKIQAARVTKLVCKALRELGTAQAASPGMP